MQLEDRQIIRRSLDRHFQLGRFLVPLAIFRAVLVAQDRLDRLQAQRSTTAVNQRMEHLIHLPADLENKVPAVFDLIVGVLIMKPALLLLIQIEREAQAGGINPTLADLAQLPYSPLLGQGVCDLRQPAASEI